MKKIYITPSVDIYEIKAKTILMASTDTYSETVAGEGTENSTVNFSRGFDFDDEE